MRFLLVCVLAASAPSQWSSPPGWLQKEGNSAFLNTIGWFSSGRYMLVDREFRGTTRSIKGMAFRPDNRFYNASTGMGRAFSSVTVDMAECSYDFAVRSFSLNAITTPTRVFNASIVWPTLTGVPAKKPADWVASFPFASTWSYTGKNDICADFKMSGGTLANGAGWNQQTSYVFDGVSYPPTWSWKTTTSQALGNSGANQGCRDSAATTTFGATVSTVSTTYNSEYSNPWFRDRIVFSQTGSYFGKNTTVATLLGFRALTSGAPFPGVTCNRVHVDTTLPTAVFLQQSTSIGGLAKNLFGATYRGVPYDASLVGATLVTQGAWDDTKTGAVKLSSAATNTVNAMPARSGSARHLVGYTNVINSPIALALIRIGTLWRYSQ